MRISVPVVASLVGTGLTSALLWRYATSIDPWVRATSAALPAIAGAAAAWASQGFDAVAKAREAATGSELPNAFLLTTRLDAADEVLQRNQLIIMFVGAFAGALTALLDKLPHAVWVAAPVFVVCLLFVFDSFRARRSALRLRSDVLDAITEREATKRAATALAAEIKDRKTKVLVASQ